MGKSTNQSNQTNLNQTSAPVRIREVRQARLLLMEIGSYLNMVISKRCSDQMKISRLDAIRDEKLFNETLDKIEDLSVEIYKKLNELKGERPRITESSPDQDQTTVTVLKSDLDNLMWKIAYIHNLVRKVETVGECTGTMIRGPKI